MIRRPATYELALSLALGAVALAAPSARAAVNVVTCNPTDGLASVATASPPLVNNVSTDASYGLQLQTRIDGCTANAAQLNNWVPAKLGGTPNGALIDKADVKLKVKGFGTCDFTNPTPAAYPASGKLQVKWLDGSGSGVPKATPSSAYVRVKGDPMTFSAISDGVVTKGLGMGADIHSEISFDLASLTNTSLLVCNLVPPYTGPALTEIALLTTASSTLSIDFP